MIPKSIYEKLLQEAEKSDCHRAHCSAVAITNEDSPDFVCGFNHHIGDSFCLLEEGHCLSAVHAEMDMICYAAREGISLKGAEVISLERPCQRCLVVMADAGIKKVAYIRDYHSRAHGKEVMSSILLHKLSVTRKEPDV